MAEHIEDLDVFLVGKLILGGLWYMHLLWMRKKTGVYGM
jgi:hypothetical protein